VRRPPRTAVRAIVTSDQQESAMNKDQVKGRIEEATGKVKEVTGKVTGDKDLEQEGKVQNIGGKVQAGYGDLKEDIKTAVEGL
jgi:uncharacterized protein YjbJ (UPF0337 family)